MTTEKRILRDDNERRDWCQYLYRQPLPLRVAALDGDDRTLSQNALLHKWCTEIGHQMGESMDEVKARAKLEIGVPILCRDDPVFNGFYHHALKPLTYEQRLKSMTYVSVTSTMTVDQMREFMDTFEREYRSQGMVLTQPEAA